MMAQSKLSQRKWFSGDNHGTGQFLLPRAFRNSVLHRTQKDVTPSPSFRRCRNHRTIHALGVTRIGGFSIRQPLILTPDTFVFSISILPHNCKPISKRAVSKDATNLSIRGEGPFRFCDVLDRLGKYLLPVLGCTFLRCSGLE
jgi:hypothetical protein